MKIKSAIGITLLAAFSLFAFGSLTQKSSAQTNADSTAPSPTMNNTMGQHGMMTGGTMHSGMMQGRMMHGNQMNGRGMMGHTMMGNYSSMQQLMHKLASDLSAARAEAGSATMKSKLADAGSLVSKLQDEFSNSWGMMMHSMPMNSSYCWNRMGQQPQQKQ